MGKCRYLQDKEREKQIRGYYITLLIIVAEKIKNVGGKH
jgi:hypothetical protein